jgi:hypothetical protein
MAGLISAAVLPTQGARASPRLSRPSGAKSPTARGRVVMIKAYTASSALDAYCAFYCFVTGHFATVDALWLQEPGKDLDMGKPGKVRPATLQSSKLCFVGREAQGVQRVCSRTVFAAC